MSGMRWYAGVDPGASGAIAFVSRERGEERIIRLDGTPHDILLEVERLRIAHDVVHAYIEKVSAMPKQGVASTFKFGRSFGECIMLMTALGIPYTFITPAKWQQAMQARSRGDKNVTKRRAQQLYPHLDITHRNADALLIASLCRDVHAAFQWEREGVSA